VLENGTRSGARALRSLLADLGGLIDRAQVKSPAIVVVGEVVDRSDCTDMLQLSAFAEQRA
jgi:uroporphyrin-III C-methyltransferase